eukprot:2272424-Ditylum_brightwellii.AAC.1
MKETLMAGQMVCRKAILMATLWDAPKANAMASKMVMKDGVSIELVEGLDKESKLGKEAGFPLGMEE